MFEFNGVGIKCAEDMQEALQIETHRDHFVNKMKAMIERDGLDSALGMLGEALCGRTDEPLKTQPLLKFKKRYVRIPGDPDHNYELVDICERAEVVKVYPLRY